MFNPFNPYEPTKSNNFRASIQEQSVHIQRVVNRVNYIEHELHNMNYFDRSERFALILEREDLRQQMEQFHSHLWIYSTYSPSRYQSFKPSRFQQAPIHTTKNGILIAGGWNGQI